MGGRAQSRAGASCCRLQPWPPAAPQPGRVAVATLGVPRLLRVPRPAERCRSAPRPCSSTSSAPPPSGVSSARGSAPGCPSLRCPLWGEMPETSLPGGGGGSGRRGAIAGWEVGVSVLGWGHPEPRPLAVMAPWPAMEEQSRRGVWSIGQGAVGNAHPRTLPALRMREGSALRSCHDQVPLPWTVSLGPLPDGQSQPWGTFPRGGAGAHGRNVVSAGTGLTQSSSRAEVSAGVTGFELCRGQEGSAPDFGWVHGTVKDSCTVWTQMQMLIPKLLPKTSEVFGSRVLAWARP